MPVDQVPEGLVRIVTRYQHERRENEPFYLWARRTSSDQLAGTLAGASETVTQ